MDTKNTLTVNKTANESWKVLGKEFGNIGAWASVIADSKTIGEPFSNDVAFSAREVATPNGATVHQLTSYDNDNMSLSYKVTVGAPPFANLLTATWLVTPLDDNTSDVSLAVHVDIKEGVPEEKKAEINMYLNKTGDMLLEEFKHYTETRQPHPRNMEQV